MYKLVTILVFILHVLPIFAQDAKQLLNEAAAKLENQNIEVVFDVTSYKGVEPENTIDGRVRAEGRKFRLATDVMDIWFDGKTQWTHLRGSDEVNVTEPTPEELAQMSPTYFIQFYQHGKAYAAEAVTYMGLKCWQITVSPKDEEFFKRLLIIIDAHKNVRNVRLLNSNNRWVRFRIGSVKTGMHFPAHLFEFAEASHPNYEIIDLR